MNFDKRLTPARPDLAAAHLIGQVVATRFVEGRRMRVAEELIAVLGEPTPEASLQTQALFGEEVMVYEDYEGWAWGQLLRDGYVGYFSANALREPGPATTHMVDVPRSFAWPGASIKLPVLQALPMGARVAVVDVSGEFARLADGSFVWAKHLSERPAEGSQTPREGSQTTTTGSQSLAKRSQIVDAARKFLNVPYLWGGKTSLGLDCSGLVQVALDTAGILAPRDSDMQAKALGAALEITPNLADLQTGDLIFWRGHVGIMENETQLLHSNGHHMMVASEPLLMARDRISQKSYGPITYIRRLG